MAKQSPDRRPEEIMFFLDEMARVIIEKSDDEILEELSEEGLDEEAIASVFDSILDSACGKVARAEWEAAGAELNARKNSVVPVARKSTADVRVLIMRAQQAHPQLTKAARNEVGELSDEEAFEMLQDFIELGMVSNEDLS